MTDPLVLPPGKFFRAEEFACHDGTPYPIDWRDRWLELRDLSDGARIIHGGPLDVVSGYRTPTYNADLFAASTAAGTHGVASSSEHIEGNAGDMRARIAPASALYSELLIAYQDDFRFTNADGKERRFRDLLGGIGVYPISNWVHIDTRKAPDGHLRRWHGR